MLDCSLNWFTSFFYDEWLTVYTQTNEWMNSLRDTYAYETNCCLHIQLLLHTTNTKSDVRISPNWCLDYNCVCMCGFGCHRCSSLSLYSLVNWHPSQAMLAQFPLITYQTFTLECVLQMFQCPVCSRVLQWHFKLHQPNQLVCDVFIFARLTTHTHTDRQTLTCAHSKRFIKLVNCLSHNFCFTFPFGTIHPFKHKLNRIDIYSFALAFAADVWWNILTIWMNE